MRHIASDIRKMIA